YYRQKQYKPEHKSFSFNKISNKVESEVKLKKWRLIERLSKAVKHSCPLIELSGNNINVKKIENASEAYSDFMSKKPTTTLICLSVASRKTKTLREILNSLAKSHSHIVILDETNSIMHQIASGIHARESENAMRNLLKLAVHMYQPRKSKTIKILYDSNKGSEAIRKGLEMHKEEILCSLIASTGASLELIAVEDTKLAKAFRTEVFYTIKNTKKRIKSSNAELIVNAPNINSNKAEMLKLNPESKQWRAMHDLLQSVGFSDIDNMNIFSGNDTRAKRMPDLNSAIKFINAILSNWCSYTVKSGETYVGSRGHQVCKKLFWIYHVSDNGADFETQERIKAIKLNNPNYHPTIPILLPYKPESIDETQELFDSIPIITDITILKFSNEVCEDSFCNNIVEKSVTKLSQLPSSKELPESLISLSLEYLIKNESDISTFILLLQQKFQILKEKLEQWRTKITFELQDNQNY
ncbi:18208_t:CDS:2, partial [Cetraspora pellucida]